MDRAVGKVESQDWSVAGCAGQGPIFTGPWYRWRHGPISTGPISTGPWYRWRRGPISTGPWYRWRHGPITTGPWYRWRHGPISTGPWYRWRGTTHGPWWLWGPNTWKVQNNATDQRYYEVEFKYLVFTRMPGDSYRRRLRFLLLYLCYVFRALI